jgi:hypothetical protein
VNVALSKVESWKTTTSQELGGETNVLSSDEKSEKVEMMNRESSHETALNLKPGQPPARRYARQSDFIISDPVKRPCRSQPTFDISP